MVDMLIADSGATKCEWCLLNENGQKKIITTGINPYFLPAQKMVALLEEELLPSLSSALPQQIFFYGSGLGNENNKAIVETALVQLFPDSSLIMDTDIMASARATCGSEPGIVCILGTGSNSCYYDGEKIAKNIPGIGYVLGDEGSGTYLGKKVLQHYLYNTFDEDLQSRFTALFPVSRIEILENVYSKPSPNRYIASFTKFLAENRGHYMIENIIEDGLNDFFFQHICKFGESWTSPIHFTGGVASGFKDALSDLCKSYQVTLGKVLKNPIEGLIEYHKGVKSS